MLLAAACAGSGEPESFEDQPDAEGVPAVEANFIEACEHAGEQEADEAIQGRLDAVCQCSYDEMEQILTFEEFQQLDDDFRDDINTPLPPEVQAAIAGCIREEAGLSG